MERGKTIKLLSNEPCREDAFEGHAHENIAEQVARIIKEDDKRHIIGIEGGWGSGKSNLICLVNKELNGQDVYDKDFDHKSSAYPFFIYDAWGHQSDYQRRAILEELTHDLTNEKKVLSNGKWKQKLEILLAKRQKTTTKEVPRLGIGVVVGIILCIITPLLTYLVEQIPDKVWYFKLLIATIPYILGAMLVIWNRCTSLKRNGQDRTLSNIASELILLYKDQIKENETYTTISEKEPSSAEFKDWMDEVNQDLKNVEKTLVIVFDNMDRLPSQKVESLWSSIHSFFSDKTYDHIKVLIPFDRLHIQQAFKNEDANDEPYGNDFINKTFDVVFRIPPPIMTGWQQYMSEKWKDAFGQNAELHISVTQIYDALSKSHTPRKIIAFINEVATIKMTMRDNIPDRYIALFSFGKEMIEKDPIKQLLNPEFMGDVKFEYEKDPNAIKYLSALYYQLPVEKALDVVFTKEATDALNSGNANRLHEMMERISMSPILSNAILKVTDVEKATLTLASLDDYCGYTDYDSIPDWLKKIWNDLYQKCLNMNVMWNEIKEFHVPLFTHLYDNSLAEELIKGYLSIDDEKWDAKRYVETVDKLKANNDLIDICLEEHKRKTSPQLFLNLLQYTKDRYGDYGIMFEKTELDTYLSKLTSEAVLSIGVIPYINFEKGKDFPKYISKLKEWIGEAEVNDIKRIHLLFDRLKEVADKPLDFETYMSDAVISNGWTELIDTQNEFKYDLLAMRVARRDSFQSNYRHVFKNIIDAPEKEDVEKLTNVIEYYMDYGDLLERSDFYKSYPLVVDVVKKITMKSYCISHANIMQCLTFFDHTVDDYGLDATQLYKRLEDWSENIKFDNQNVVNMPTGLFEQARLVDNKISKALHEACDSYYSGLSQDLWKEHMQKHDHTYRIWKLYHPKKYQANFDALKSLLKDYASGVSSILNEELTTEWLNICLEVNHSVKALFNEISAILKKDSIINKEKLLFFGPWILAYTDAEKQEDFVEKLIPTEIVDPDVLRFVSKNIGKLKDCIIPDEFKEKIKHLVETSMREDEAAITLCKTLGIEYDKDEG